MSSADDRHAEFTCDLCGEHFETKAGLKDHVWEYHELDGDVPP